jgi:hypothetical protein
MAVTKSLDSLKIGEREVSSMICPISWVIAASRFEITATAMGSSWIWLMKGRL